MPLTVRAWYGELGNWDSSATSSSAGGTLGIGPPPTPGARPVGRLKCLCRVPGGLSSAATYGCPECGDFRGLCPCWNRSFDRLWPERSMVAAAVRTIGIRLRLARRMVFVLVSMVGGAQCECDRD